MILDHIPFILLTGLEERVLDARGGPRPHLQRVWQLRHAVRLRQVRLRARWDVNGTY